MTWFLYVFGLIGFVLAVPAYAEVAKLKLRVVRLEPRQPRA